MVRFTLKFLFSLICGKKCHSTSLRTCEQPWLRADLCHSLSGQGSRLPGASVFVEPLAAPSDAHTYGQQRLVTGVCVHGDPSAKHWAPPPQLLRKTVSLLKEFSCDV